jgi:polar amino acid transport system substrate-binding protein
MKLKHETVVAGKQKPSHAAKFLVVPLLVLSLIVTACGSASTAAKKSVKKQVIDGIAVYYNPHIAKLLPKNLRGGTLKDISYAAALPSVGVVKGKLSGWEVQLGEAVAAVLGMKFVGTPSTAFDSFIPSIQAGRYNVSFDSFIVLPSRLKEVDILGVFKDGTTFATKKNSGITINKVTDLCGHSVAVIAGSAYIPQITAIGPSCKALGKSAPVIMTFPDQSSAALAVQSGRAQVFATLADQMGYYLKATGYQLVESPLEVDATYVGPAIKKGIGLSRPIANAMNYLIKTGVYAKILAYWGVHKGLVFRAKLFK